MLQLDEVTAGYSHVPVLKHVTLRVEPDEIVGVLGANGSGKTTLLRTIAGVLSLKSGAIKLGDQSIGSSKPWRRVRMGLAHVPEGRHVFGAMTVRENLEVARLVVSGADESRLERVLAMFPRLDERQEQAAGSMSGGEQQMLAIARALMTEPDFLLVDEMSAGLAPVIVDDLVESLVEIHTSGVGVLLVEQSPHVVADLLDRIYLIERGEIVGEGSLDDVGGAEALAERYLGVHSAAGA